MAVNVNPPPQLRIPEVILQNPQWREYERQRDVILFQLWQRTGGDNDLISEGLNQVIQTFSSNTQCLQKQIDGLPEFTCDTTGFTADQTTWTADKVIA